MNTLVRCFCYIVSFLYISFFMPIFPFIAPLGALVTVREGVGTVATFSCIIATSAIPAYSCDDGYGPDPQKLSPQTLPRNWPWQGSLLSAFLGVNRL